MSATPKARLGSVERVYRIRPGLRRARFAVALACSSAAVAVGAYSALRALIAFTQYGPLLVGRWAGPAALAGLGLAAVASILLWRAWQTSRLRVRIHADGLALVRGRRGRALRWDQIRSLWSRSERTGLPGLPGSRRNRLEVEAVDGRRFRLNESLEDFENLAGAIKSRVYPDRLSAYSRAFNEGQTISFGPLQLGRDGVFGGRKGILRWDQLRSAGLERGRLRIEADRDGRRATLSFPAHRIPDVELCAQMIEEIRRSA